MKKLLLLLLLSFGFVGSVYADMKAGDEAFNNMDFELAIKEFLPLAINENPEAQKALGKTYLTLWIKTAVEEKKEHLSGWTENNIYTLSDKYYVESYLWFAEAVKNKNKEAIGYFQNFFNFNQMKMLVIQQAELGLPSAQYLLGIFYGIGRPGILKNYRKSFYWTEKSAQQGFALAQFTTGIFYLSGRGVEASKEKGAYWIYLASENGYEEAEKIWNENELWNY